MRQAEGVEDEKSCAVDTQVLITDIVCRAYVHVKATSNVTIKHIKTGVQSSKIGGHPLASESHILLNLLDGFCRIQTLWTSSRAVENGVASVQAHAVIQHLLPFRVALITGVNEPTI